MIGFFLSKQSLKIRYRLDGDQQATNVLELGAGTGWPGTKGLSPSPGIGSVATQLSKAWHDAGPQRGKQHGLPHRAGAE